MARLFPRGSRADSYRRGLDHSQRLSQMFQDDRKRVQGAGGRSTGSALRLHEALKQRPLLSIVAACERTGLSFPTTSSAMNLLVEQGLVRELTGRPRNRVFVYDEYLAILSEEERV